MVQPSEAYWSTNAQDSSPQPWLPQPVPQEFSTHTPLASYLAANRAWPPQYDMSAVGTPMSELDGPAHMKLSYTGMPMTIGWPAARVASMAAWLPALAPKKTQLYEVILYAAAAATSAAVGWVV